MSTSAISHPGYEVIPRDDRPHARVSGRSAMSVFGVARLMARCQPTLVSVPAHRADAVYRGTAFAVSDPPPISQTPP